MGANLRIWMYQPRLRPKLTAPFDTAQDATLVLNQYPVYLNEQLSLMGANLRIGSPKLVPDLRIRMYQPRLRLRFTASFDAAQDATLRRSRNAALVPNQNAVHLNERWSSLMVLLAEHPYSFAVASIDIYLEFGKGTNQIIEHFRFQIG